MPSSLSTPPAPRIVFAEASDPGCDPKKQINEDSCGHTDLPGGSLLVVCDGMGGHAGGREASQIAVKTILADAERAARETPDIAPHDALRGAVMQAGRAVYGLGGSEVTAGRPGSTCVAILIHAGGTEVAHAGDSRIFVVRNGQIWQITRDHSLVQQMIDSGTVRPEDAYNHPDAHVVTRALGMRAEIDVELRHDPFPHQAGDLFLLVSDGVTDVTSPNDLLTLIARADSTNLQPLCDSIVQFARDRGGPDNITVQAALLLDTAEIEHVDRKTVTDISAVASIPSGGQSASSAIPSSNPSSAPPSPAPASAQAPPAPTHGTHGTVVLPAVSASALATPTPGSSGSSSTASPSARPISSRTVVDDPSDASAAHAPTASRTPRFVLAGLLLAVGLLVFAVSLYEVLQTSESPPPLPEHPGTGPTASGLAATTSAAAPVVPAPTASASSASPRATGSARAKH